uniref:Uncharacterized protein n=1 Tax=Aegilops tauschii subsp. strangulata TaxID=200361 RepID=A0A453HMV8_AEGTS
MTIADHFVVDLVTDGHDMPGQLQEVDSSCPELENGMPVWFILPGTIGTWHQSTLAEFRCVGYGSFCRLMKQDSDAPRGVEFMLI